METNDVDLIIEFTRINNKQWNKEHLKSKYYTRIWNVINSNYDYRWVSIVDEELRMHWGSIDWEYMKNLVDFGIKNNFEIKYISSSSNEDPNILVFKKIGEENNDRKQIYQKGIM